MDIGRMLSWTAERYPGRLAVGGPRPLTWRQWDARTNQLARALAGQGVRPGDRVAFGLAGGEPMASLHLAVQKLGAAAVPLSIRFGPPELAYCVRDAEPTLVIGDDTTSASLGTALAGGPPVRSQEELDELAQREPDGELTQKHEPGRPQRHPLHLGHHRPSEGRPAHPPGRARRRRRPRHPDPAPSR